MARTPLKLCIALALTAILVLSMASSAPALILQSQSFQVSGADAKPRLEVRCPGKRNLPYAGGMITDPAGLLDGEGVYPHSYERLGVQRGWHVTPVLFDPLPPKSGPRSVTLQVVCGPRLGPVSSPHSTVFVGPGQSKTAIATCPGGNKLYAGGFQRTNFVSRGGNYVTESRAISDRAWQVSGSAFGTFGGELTAIAYCLRSRGPLVSEVTAETELPLMKSASATTPSCPAGTSLIGGGFRTSPTGPALVSSAYFNGSGSWTAEAFNRFGPAATLSAHGYCMGNNTIKRRKGMKHGVRKAHEKNIKAPPVLDAALKVAISERVTRQGCFPGPAELAEILRQNKINAVPARGPRSVNRAGVVHVLSDHASCERVRLGVRRNGRVIVLDSATGEVRQHFV